ncbi:RGG repeats nuclear RNA binding protein B [Lachnellula cervina]|uniref:RGG repeats nuclear RNA binding protein B n=1 Tax=Lachnellula cervina TaxID=1316786 RepID=A0A7D8YQV0_9HELO|nr:RGG repeats nuclear RNA binding protein B [Lachnellula cervina]
MSTQIASKNLYELLGNNHDEDSDKEPEPPVKVVDKTPARTTKRNAPAEAPASKPAAGSDNRGGRRGGFNGNEGAFRDRQAGSSNNRGKPTGDAGQQDRAPRNERAQGTYDGRGGRGNRGGNRTFDRHSRGVGGESEKQAAHGWGATEGEAELKDEEAGEALAKADQKDALTGDGDAAPADGEAAVEAEPEDNSKSYAEYLEELAEKKAALNADALNVRKPNEGSKEDKKWLNAKAIAKEEEEDFVAGSGGKAKRERERKQKQTLDIDQRFVEAPERGRGGFRGGRGRGDGPPRGDRADRGNFRGGRGDRGGRGGRGGDFRGPPRGNTRNNAGPSSTINTEDKSAFPSLGS